MTSYLFPNSLENRQKMCEAEKSSCSKWENYINVSALNLTSVADGDILRNGVCGVSHSGMTFWTTVANIVTCPHGP